MVGFSDADTFNNATLDNWPMSADRAKGARIISGLLRYIDSAGKADVDLGGITAAVRNIATGKWEVQFESDFDEVPCPFASCSDPLYQAHVYELGDDYLKIMTEKYNGASWDLSNEPMTEGGVSLNVIGIGALLFSEKTGATTGTKISGIISRCNEKHALNSAVWSPTDDLKFCFGRVTISSGGAIIEDGAVGLADVAKDDTGEATLYFSIAFDARPVIIVLPLCTGSTVDDQLYGSYDTAGTSTTKIYINDETDTQVNGTVFVFICGINSDGTGITDNSSSCLLTANNLNRVMAIGNSENPNSLLYTVPVISCGYTKTNANAGDDMDADSAISNIDHANHTRNAAGDYESPFTTTYEQTPYSLFLTPQTADRAYCIGYCDVEKIYVNTTNGANDTLTDLNYDFVVFGFMLISGSQSTPSGSTGTPFFQRGIYLGEEVIVNDFPTYTTRDLQFADFIDDEGIYDAGESAFTGAKRITSGTLTYGYCIVETPDFEDLSRLFETIGGDSYTEADVYPRQIINLQFVRMTQEEFSKMMRFYQVIKGKKDRIELNDENGNIIPGHITSWKHDKNIRESKVQPYSISVTFRVDLTSSTETMKSGGQISY